MMPFERFEAWRQAHGLALDVYKVSARWPVQERYGLISQARRAAYSIPSNIAEGTARRGSNEFARFLNIALGSFSELTYLLYLARDLGYLSADEWSALEERRTVTGKLLWSLYARVRKR
jgi:four helix bundle protein